MAIEIDWDREEPEHRERVLEEAHRLARKLRTLGATRVVLFGSRARGSERKSSDLDMLAIVPSPPPGSFPARLRAVYELLQPRVPTDILVYTPDEVQRMPPGSLVDEALASGVEL